MFPEEVRWPQGRGGPGSRIVIDGMKCVVRTEKATAQGTSEKGNPKTTHLFTSSFLPSGIATGSVLGPSLVEPKSNIMMRHLRTHSPRLAVIGIGLLALSILLPAYGSLDGLPEKAATDRSEYRHLVLDNGLRVILLSDPDLNKSSAAMAIAAGSLMDPAELQGLAHFLEHMLFLGTEKYPGEGDYGNFIRSNGGFANAYTAGDHTNYHFEINHDAFAGAVDRLAQFFIAPLFTEEFTEREMNAVDSENEKNLEQDSRRLDQVQRSYFRAGHPENHFSTGNSLTLADIEREDFISYYRKHYSANQLALALAGTASLDELEALARTSFSEVENLETPTVVYPSDVLEPKPVVRLLQIEPITDLRDLVMDFPLPATRDRFAGKSLDLVGQVFGYEGAGSLLSLLKEAGLATGMSAGAWDVTADYSMLSLTAKLTPEGLEQWQEVMKITFAYIENMRQSPFPEFLFHEAATMARLDEVYADKGEGIRRATTLSNHALQYPLELAERIDYLYVEPDPDTWFAILDTLRPDTMIASLVAKGVPTDRKEQYYGTDHSYTEINGAFYESVANPEVGPEITFIEPNPFVPTQADLLAQRPVQLIDEPGLTLYFSQDAEFARPQVAAVIKIRQPQRGASLRTAVLKSFYQAVVTEMMNEVTYAALTAGLTLNLSAALDGVTVSVSGYSQSANELTRYVIDNLTVIDFSEERFAALKDKMIRELSNADRLDAYRQARETKRKVLQEVYFTPEEQLPVAEGVTLDDVRGFARSLYSEGKIEAVIHGNVSADEAIDLVCYVSETLGQRSVAEDALFEPRLIVQDEGSEIISIDRLAVNNSCFWSEYFLGDDSPDNRAAALFINNFMEEPFYTEMRTRQQLGYIVWSFTFPQEDELFGGFIIQSADYPADELQQRIKAFLTILPGLLSELSEDDFTTIVAGVRAQIEEKDTSIAERTSRYFVRAFEQDGEWDRQAATLAALDELTPEKVSHVLDRMLSPETRRVRTVLAFARQHEPMESTVQSYDNLTFWKREQKFD